eukprot:TRINITY_DN18091_c0_g1_i2.p1 TRINITY_DN18091_c0_g1~~TRINITY_DN18091_c0_g1_i2.p1  ORF type:complete len:228 (+),score=65.54 TRINITY_DN18091_c0_g1_i2:72-686(+)
MMSAHVELLVRFKQIQSEREALGVSTERLHAEKKEVQAKATKAHATVQEATKRLNSYAEARAQAEKQVRESHTAAEASLAGLKKRALAEAEEEEAKARVLRRKVDETKAAGGALKSRNDSVVNQQTEDDVQGTSVVSRRTAADKAKAVAEQEVCSLEAEVSSIRSSLECSLDELKEAASNCKFKELVAAARALGDEGRQLLNLS